MFVTVDKITVPRGRQPVPQREGRPTLVHAILDTLEMERLVQVWAYGPVSSFAKKCPISLNRH